MRTWLRFLALTNRPPLTRLGSDHRDKQRARRGIPAAALLTLALAGAASATPDEPEYVDTNCYTLVLEPAKTIRLGPIPCQCPNGPELEVNMAMALPGGTVQVDLNPEGSGSNGGLVCYETIYEYPPFYFKKSGGTDKVTAILVEAGHFKQKCILGGCGSALWGLFSWGGPECRTVQIKPGPKLISYMIQGPCELPTL